MGVYTGETPNVTACSSNTNFEVTLWYRIYVFANSPRLQSATRVNPAETRKKLRRCPMVAAHSFPARTAHQSSKTLLLVCGGTTKDMIHAPIEAQRGPYSNTRLVKSLFGNICRQVFYFGLLGSAVSEQTPSLSPFATSYMISPYTVHTFDVNKVYIIGAVRVLNKIDAEHGWTRGLQLRGHQRVYGCLVRCFDVE